MAIFFMVTSFILIAILAITVIKSTMKNRHDDNE
jgi:hypothetical protein